MNRALLLFVLTLSLVAPSLARGDAALPDLVPQPFGAFVAINNVAHGDFVEGCAGGETNRRLLRFSLRTTNAGPGDLLLGNPQCPDCIAHPGASCGNPLFVCGTAHGHVHFNSFADAELLDGDGNVVASGRKRGFCILDSECPTFTYTCNFQGLTAGCSDVYTSNLPCQYIDITNANVPDGIYTLRVTSDPDNRIAEANEGNNVATLQVQIGGGPPTPTSAPTPAPLCAPMPRTNCHQSPRSIIAMRNAIDSRRHSLSWQWQKGSSTRAAFGDPLTVTRNDFCLYDESGGDPALVMGAEVPNAGTCGRHPCWRLTGISGFRYGDAKATSDGISAILLRKGDVGKAKVIVRGKGVNLPLPPLPIDHYSQLRAQLVNSDNECWEAVYTAPAALNAGDKFKDVTP